MKHKGELLDKLPASVQTVIEDDLLIVKLCRAQKSNAINDEIILAIEQIFSSVPHGVKCAILYGRRQAFQCRT
jgi:enoyl-CoA hydratase/carnithine racemase